MARSKGSTNRKSWLKRLSKNEELVLARMQLDAAKAADKTVEEFLSSVIDEYGTDFGKETYADGFFTPEEAEASGEIHSVDEMRGHLDKMFHSLYKDKEGKDRPKQKDAMKKKLASEGLEGLISENGRITAPLTVLEYTTIEQKRRGIAPKELATENDIFNF